MEDFMALEKAVTPNEGSRVKTYSGIENLEEARKEIAENEIYLVYKEGRLVGSVAFQMKTTDHAYISGLVTHPDFQGQGIGREALGLVLEKLKNIKKVDLVTHPNNERSLKLYTSFGFKQEGEIMPNYFGDGEPRVRLVLDWVKYPPNASAV